MEENFDFKEADMTTLVSEIYSDIPKEIGLNKVIPMPENESDIDDDFLVFVFQMLIEFYTEGLCHAKKLKNIIDRKKYEVDYDEIKKSMKLEIYDEINFKDLNEATLEYPKEWIKSLGYRLNIAEENYIDYKDFIDDPNFKDKYYMGNHYCKIVFRYNTRDTMYFDYKNIKKPYHFLINNNFKNDKTKNIDDIYALIFQNTLKNENEYKVYKISFSEIKITDSYENDNKTLAIC